MQASRTAQRTASCCLHAAADQARQRHSRFERLADLDAWADVGEADRPHPSPAWQPPDSRAPLHSARSQGDVHAGQDGAAATGQALRNGLRNSAVLIVS